ncbi:putative reverse transcriptase domain-containing protein, partial [Tanacetum coccineum]
DEAVRNGSLKRNSGESSKEGNVKGDNKRARTGKCLPQLQTLLGKRHFAKDYRTGPKMVNPLNARNPTAARGACYEYGGTNQYKAAYPRLNRAPVEGGNRPNQTLSIGGDQGRGNNGNPAHGRAFVMRAEEARQDLNIVMGAMPVVEVSLIALATSEIEELSNQLKETQDKGPVGQNELDHDNSLVEPSIWTTLQMSVNDDLHSKDRHLDTDMGISSFKVTPFGLLIAPVVFRDLMMNEWDGHDKTRGACDGKWGEGDCLCLWKVRRYTKNSAPPITLELDAVCELMKRRSDGALYFMDRIWVPLTGDVRTLILDEAHKSRYSVHPVAGKMYDYLRDMYWWSMMKKDIAMYVSKCLTCLKVKAEHQRPFGLLQQPEIPKWSVRCAPFEALYGRMYCSPILWAEIGEGQLIGPKIVQETTEKIS